MTFNPIAALNVLECRNIISKLPNYKEYIKLPEYCDVVKLLEKGIAILRDRLEEGILSSCVGAVLNGDKLNRLPNTTNISFEYLDGEAILFMLDDHDICVSTGSACESGSLEASHVLKSMEISRNMINGAIRFSLGEQTTEKDIDKLIEVLPPIINRCRELAPNI